MNVPGPLVRVKSVEPLEKFLVRITFQNGIQKEIDPDVLYYDLKPAWMEETVKP